MIFKILKKNLFYWKRNASVYRKVLLRTKAAKKNSWHLLFTLTVPEILFLPLPNLYGVPLAFTTCFSSAKKLSVQLISLVISLLNLVICKKKIRAFDSLFLRDRHVHLFNF
jgi:hypothetical protein